MDAKRRKKLKELGGRVTTAQEFLGLSNEDVAVVEIRVALAKGLQQRRKLAKLTQAQLAKNIRSSQSRVAKMEGGDPQASIESLIRAIHATGTRVQLTLSPGHASRSTSRGTERRSRSGARSARNRTAA